MKKMKLFLLCIVAGVMGAKAQMGYQISLLNTATGEPRANETVTVSVSLSNNANEVFYTETKSATTNDFGVLSLSIGNADTFKNVDLFKMPFFIEVTANGVMIGKSQILSVPVAEVAKQLAPIDKSLIVGTWKSMSGESYYHLYTFMDNNTVSITYYRPSSEESWGTYKYVVEGSFIYIYGRYEIDLKSDDLYLFQSFKLLDGILFGDNRQLEKIQ
jgi:hypothetical protein